MFFHRRKAKNAGSAGRETPDSPVLHSGTTCAAPDTTPIPEAPVTTEEGERPEEKVPEKESPEEKVPEKESPEEKGPEKESPEEKDPEKESPEEEQPEVVAEDVWPIAEEDAGEMLELEDGRVFPRAFVENIRSLAAEDLRTVLDEQRALYSEEEYRYIEEVFAERLGDIH